MIQRLTSSAFAPAALLAVAALCTTSPAAQAERTLQLGPGGNNWQERDPQGIVTTYGDANDLVNCLVGPDITVFNAVLNAHPDAAGTFTGGAGILGFDSGLILSTGNIAFVTGPNLQDNITQENGFPGDPDLDALIPGFTTNDAAILEFDFECAEPIEISFQFVFGSDEYNEFVFSSFNDVFAFFVNGTNVGDNIATVPAICSDPGIPVTINNVNCENPYNPPNGLNCNCYRNNDLEDGGGAIDTEMDGLTETFFASTTILPGVNHIKIAIADAGDFAWDSNVFIKCESFVCEAPPATGACCLPGGDCVVTTAGDCAQAGGVYVGDNVPCDPDPCVTGAEDSNWGQVKRLYR